MAATNFSGPLKLGGTQVLTAQQAAIVSLTNAVGTGNDALQDVTATFSQTILNNNFKDVTDKIEEILGVLRTHGLIVT